MAQGSQRLSFLSRETNPSTSGQSLTCKGKYYGKILPAGCAEPVVNIGSSGGLFWGFFFFSGEIPWAQASY